MLKEDFNTKLDINLLHLDRLYVKNTFKIKKMQLIF